MRNQQRWTMEDAVAAKDSLERNGVRNQLDARAGLSARAPGDIAVLEANAAILQKELKDGETKKLQRLMRWQLDILGLGAIFVEGWKLKHDQCKGGYSYFDFYCERYQVALELHGGIFNGGRHTRGEGFTRDRVKMNAAIEHGIVVLEYTTEQIKQKDNYALNQIERVLASRGWIKG